MWTSAFSAASAAWLRGRVFGLMRALGLLLGEGRLVHEHVGLWAATTSASQGAVSPESTSLRPRRGGPIT